MPYPTTSTTPEGGEGLTSEGGGEALGGQALVDSIIAQEESRHEAEANGLPAEPTTTQRYKVKVAGEEVEVSLDELLSGYSRQSDYTRKTQQLKTERDSIESQRKALFESDAYKMIQQAAQAEGGEFDPLDPDSVTRHIRSQVARELENMYRPVQEQYVTQAAQAKVTEFMSARPEFADPKFKGEVASLLKANESYDLETAYEVVSARRLRAERESLQTEAQRHRALLAEAGLKVGVGTPARDSGEVPAHVLKQGAVAVAEYLAKRKGSW